MRSDNIYLTPQDLYEKEFKIDARGYRPQEVDKLLDLVIRDYTEYNSIIKGQEKQLQEVLEENQKLKQDILRLNEELQIASTSSNDNDKGTTNVDILKRISQLEKVVFGKNG